MTAARHVRNDREREERVIGGTFGIGIITAAFTAAARHADAATG